MCDCFKMDIRGQVKKVVSRKSVVLVSHVTNMHLSQYPYHQHYLPWLPHIRYINTSQVYINLIVYSSTARNRKKQHITDLSTRHLAMDKNSFGGVSDYKFANFWLAQSQLQAGSSLYLSRLASTPETWQTHWEESHLGCLKLLFA